MNSKPIAMKVVFVYIILICWSQFAFSARSKVLEPSEKADQASEVLMSKTKNVSAEELVVASEMFLSPKEFESLIKDSKKVKNLTIDSIMHGEDFFYLQAGPIKVVFKWIDKDNIAFKLNGHTFTYEEAADTDLWQKKIFEVVKSYQSPRATLKKPILKQDSRFSANLGSSFTSMLILPFLYYSNPAEAFLNAINWNSGWTWTAISAGVIALVANHYYRKHKKKHKQSKSQVSAALAQARTSLENAQANGVTNLAPYQSRVNNFENLLAEYNSSSNDVGFFGFLFGNRISQPAMYESLMSGYQPGGVPSGVGGPGQPTAPPTRGTADGVE